MGERLDRINRLLRNHKSRASYIRAKLAVLVPAQIRATRLKSENPPMPYQRDLAREAEMHQSRISMFETPGAANITLDTLAKLAAALRVGVIVKLVPFHEMLQWEDSFSPDSFNVLPRLDQDTRFLSPTFSAINQTIGAAGPWLYTGNIGAAEPENEVPVGQIARKPAAPERQEHAMSASYSIGGR